MKNNPSFQFKPFSRKQKKVLSWWCDKSPVKEMDGIIADGAIRSGKTLSMAISYVLWAMTNFEGHNFGMCGKTIGSFRRNVVIWLKIALKGRGYQIKDNRSENVLYISTGSTTNAFYIFGGKDERSQDLVQGITLAGAFFDEVALMPKSFVEQATGRCSVEGSKYWFNCNPRGPMHWFKLEWIDKASDKNIIYLHFDMEDNLSLSERIKKRYRKMYAGVFFKRYILGLWVAAEGAIYGMFDPNRMIVDWLPEMRRYWIGIDYGHSNATVFLLIGEGIDNNQYAIDEYYHSGRETENAKSPVRYAKDFAIWAKNTLGKDAHKLVRIYIDPSALGFKEQLKEEGIRGIRDADNAVYEGIMLTESIVDSGIFYAHRRCKNLIREIPNYTWDTKAQAQGKDKPVKDADHALDAWRYVIMGERRYWERRVANVKPA